MPQPTSSLATLRPDLSESLEEFDLVADEAGFIAQQACPMVDVASAAGVYGKVPIAQLLQNSNLVRGPSGNYPRGSFKFGTDTYTTLEYGYEEPVDDNEAAMYANYFRAERLAAMRARHKLMLGYEVRVAGVMFDTAFFTNTGAATAHWDIAASAKPLDDVETAVQAVRAACGMRPNLMIMNWVNYRSCRRAAQILDLIKYDGHTDPKAGAIGVEVLQQLFDIPKILVAGGVKNTANEAQTAVIADIWSTSYVWVGRVAVTEDPKEPSAVRSFHWGGDGSSLEGTMETYRDEPVRADIVRNRHQVQEKQQMAACGYLISGVD